MYFAAELEYKICIMNCYRFVNSQLLDSLLKLITVHVHVIYCWYCLHCTSSSCNVIYLTLVELGLALSLAISNAFQVSWHIGLKFVVTSKNSRQWKTIFTWEWIGWKESKRQNPLKGGHFVYYIVYHFRLRLSLLILIDSDNYDWGW